MSSRIWSIKNTANNCTGSGLAEGRWQVHFGLRCFGSWNRRGAITGNRWRGTRNSIRQSISVERRGNRWRGTRNSIRQSISVERRVYCVTGKELLAVVYFTKYYRQYLLGKQFTLRTDHAALRWLQKTPEPIGQQA